MTVLNEDLGFHEYESLKFEEFLLFLFNCAIQANRDLMNEEVSEEQELTEATGSHATRAAMDSKRNSKT